MKRAVWILAILAMTTAGCGGIEWFPETKRSDTTPDAFSFTPAIVTGVEPDSLQTSNTITISGIPSGSAPISVSDNADAISEYSLDGGATFTSAAGTVKNGDTVVVQHISSIELGTTVTTTLTIGDLIATFSSKTVNVIIDPAFQSKNDALTNTTIVSNTVTVTGVNPPFVINITDGEFDVNGTGFTALQGSAQDGDTITLRHLSASIPNLAVTTTITIGGVPFTFTSTTAP